MNVIIDGKKYQAKKYRFPSITTEPRYFLCGPHGQMDTMVTGGGRHPKYVYFRWSDGQSYYLPPNVVPPYGSVVKETA